MDYIHYRADLFADNHNQEIPCAVISRC
ncbi:hypothetical protein Q8W37_21000 [Shimia thalassica]|nr:hypothetical protein [Shimia thalassica]MDP2582425.1 hypothetical protein [Shimia thalassica]